MNLFDAVVLGLVQGFAEFLPVSSSGHLVLTERILGVHQAGVSFEIFLHFATLLAIIIFFKKDIITMRLDELKAIVVASIPAAIIGVLFKDQIEAVFGSVMMVSVFLIVTGILNLVTDRKLVGVYKNSEFEEGVDSIDSGSVVNSSNKASSSKEIGIKEALIMGFFQAFAILPGISRSGSTVAGGILQNIDREKVFRFSFLMVIPVIAGASFLQLFEILGDGASNLDVVPILVGGLAAFVSGFLSLRIFEYIIKKARLEIFGYYCIGLGVLSLLIGYFG